MATEQQETAKAEDSTDDDVSEMFQPDEEELEEERQDAAARAIQGLFRAKRARHIIRELVRANYVKDVDSLTGEPIYRNRRTGLISRRKPVFLGSDDLETPRNFDWPDDYHPGQASVPQFALVITNWVFESTKIPDIPRQVEADHDALREKLEHPCYSKFLPENCFFVKNASSDVFKASVASFVSQVSATVARLTNESARRAKGLERERATTFADRKRARNDRMGGDDGQEAVPSGSPQAMGSRDDLRSDSRGKVVAPVGDDNDPQEATLLIYVSTHAAQITKGNDVAGNYLVMSDTSWKSKEALAATAISLDSLMIAVAAVQVRCKVIFLDVVHTEKEVGGFKTRHLYPACDLYDRAARISGAVVVGSCRIGATQELRLDVLRHHTNALWERAAQEDDTHNYRLGARENRSSSSGRNADGESNDSGSEDSDSGESSSSQSSDGSHLATRDDQDDQDDHDDDNSTGGSNSSALSVSNNRDSSSSEGSASSADERRLSATPGVKDSHNRASADDQQRAEDGSARKHGSHLLKREREAPPTDKCPRAKSTKMGTSKDHRNLCPRLGRKDGIPAALRATEATTMTKGDIKGAELEHGGRRPLTPAKTKVLHSERGTVVDCKPVYDRAIYGDRMSVFGRFVHEAISGECIECIGEETPARVLVMHLYDFLLRGFTPYARSRRAEGAGEAGTAGGLSAAAKEMAATEAKAAKEAARAEARRQRKLAPKAAAEENRRRKEMALRKQIADEELRRTQVPVIAGPSVEYIAQATVCAAPSPPPAPLVPVALDVGRTAVRLAWEERLFAGARPTSYEVEARGVLRNNAAWSPAFPPQYPTVTSQPLKIPHRIPGIGLQYRIRARNRGGWGDFSEPTELITTKPWLEDTQRQSTLRAMKGLARAGGPRLVIERMKRYPSSILVQESGFHQLVADFNKGVGIPRASLAQEVATVVIEAMAAFSQVGTIQGSGLLLLGWAARGDGGGGSLPTEIVEKGLALVVTAEKLHAMDTTVKAHALWARSHLRLARSGAVALHRAGTAESWAGNSVLAIEGAPADSTALIQ